MVVAISQPRYLPALIYLQRIALVDIFVLLDDVQHSREFENRNYIKTSNGKKYLSISCKKKKSRLNINELVIHDPDWITKHKNTITQNYKNAKYFSKETLDKIYQLPQTSNFSQLMKCYLQNILDILEIKTELITSSSLNIKSKKVDKLYDTLQKLNATTYISGVNGKEYLGNSLDDFNLFFHHYEEERYNQLHGEFEPWLSFIDYLFNMGIQRTKEHILQDVFIEKENFNIAILTSQNSWYVEYAKKINKQFMHSKLLFKHDDISKSYDIVFVLGYQEIIDARTLSKNNNIYIVHESNLPKGKGWAPMFWQILDGINTIPFVLFKAEEGVDSGDIYLTSYLELSGYELNAELRKKQANQTFLICLEFLLKQNILKVKKQETNDTFYKKRTPKDSILDINKTITEQFNLLRIANNEQYPAYFEIDGHRYTLEIEEVQNENR